MEKGEGKLGTRGAVGFVFQGKTLASYNHFDSYPGGLGKDVADFVNGLTTADIENLQSRVLTVRRVKASDTPTEDDLNEYGEFRDPRVSTGEDWYSLLRDVQGVGVLEMVQRHENPVLIDSTGFLQNSLFCEWAYLLNLDTGRLEIYKGFQREPHDAAPPGFCGRDADDGYYPVCKVGEVPFAQTSEEIARLIRLEAEADA